jgi:DNA-binding FrmR family transcriptional regulator
MATKKIAHVLSDEEQVVAITKRIKRAQGQLGAVARMLEAVNTAAFTLISASLKECIVEDKSNSDAVTAQLQKLFLSLA